MRPEFHFTAHEGWINDPHAITWCDGRYEVFYQYVPDSIVWAANCHWGHATGPDMMSLRELPVALAPGDGDGGIWTGCLVQDDMGEARIFYTATAEPDLGQGRIRVATPRDDQWIEWDKGAVVVEPPQELKPIAFRDPFIIREGETWRMFVGAGTADGDAHASTFVSHDLTQWNYEGSALSRSTFELDPVWMGALWECPQVVKVGEGSVMVSSVWDNDVLHYAGYALGNFDDGNFDADTWGRLTYGPSYYAPSFFLDAEERPCLTFWMRGIEDLEAGWASAHSVPYVIAIHADRLVATPHPDLVAYRGEAVESAVVGLAADVIWSPTDGSELAAVSGGAGVVVLSVAEGELLASAGDDTVHRMPWSGGEVRVIFDAQVLEISSADGLMGLAIAPEGAGLTFVGGGCAIYDLGRW